MGFYLRKSIRVGPLRFNLSKSGVGVSAGIKGLRFGSGPRGNYVHLGRGGLYYRATLPTASNVVLPEPVAPAVSQLPADSGTHAPLEEIESAHVLQLVDSSSREILDELNKKRTRVRLWPAVAVFGMIVSALAVYYERPDWQLLLVAILGGALTYAAHLRDALAKTVVLFYDFDEELEAVYARFHEAASSLAACASIWHIEASGCVHDRKYHAGASNLIQRKITLFQKRDPPYVKTNIETVAVGVGRQILHFFPDRVFIYDAHGVGAVGYEDLQINVRATQFIEEESVPTDAEIVGQTWKYVNKSGEPDRRFKDNRQLPVCRYDEISLSSCTGLNEVLQVSRQGVGNDFASAIRLLIKNMPKEILKESPTRAPVALE